MKDAVKDPTPAQISALLAKSKHRALRRIVTPDGAWYWPAENGTHRQGADSLGLEYHLPPRSGRHCNCRLVQPDELGALG